MERSENINELASALIKFHKQMKPIELDAEVEVKTKTGGSYTFKYATLNNIVEACRKPLTDNGLVISQLVGNEGGVTTLLLHESGQHLQDSILIKSAETSPQAIGSAISYAKRYSYGAILGLVTEQDDDANIAEGHQFETKKAVTKEVPWLTEKQKADICHRIKTADPNVTINENGNSVELSIDDFVKKVKNEFRMRKEYRADIESEVEFKKKLLSVTSKEVEQPEIPL